MDKLRGLAQLEIQRTGGLQRGAESKNAVATPLAIASMAPARLKHGLKAAESGQAPGYAQIGAITNASR